MPMTEPPSTPAAAGAAPAFAGPVGPAWADVRAGRMRAAHAEVTRLQRTEVAATLTPAQRALALLLRVELDLAGGELGHATADAGRLAEHSDPVADLAHELARGETAAAYGDHAEAATRFLAAGELPGAEVHLVRPWWAGAVPALVRTGRRREGAELARASLAAAETGGDAVTLAQALRALATADTGHDPVTLLRRAHDLAVSAGARRLAVQLATDIAALDILMPGQPGIEVVAALRDAEAYAVAEALWPLHNRVSALLLRVGEEPRPLAGAALEVLTQAEQRVARLAARSLSNREIAAELGISVKAIEWHLSRTYRKLGITSRQGLAAHLADD